MCFRPRARDGSFRRRHANRDDGKPTPCPRFRSQRDDSEGFGPATFFGEAPGIISGMIQINGRLPSGLIARLLCLVISV